MQKTFKGVPKKVVLTYAQRCSGKLNGSLSLELLVIYSACKCDTHPSVRYLTKEEKKVWRGFASRYWDLKLNLRLQKNL